jgi:hypothetical protein
MAIQALDTARKTLGGRTRDRSSITVSAGALASTAITYLPAPGKGFLTAGVFCNGATAHDGSNNYRVEVANMSNSTAIMVADTADGPNDFGGNDYTGAFPAAFARKDLALSATAANLTFNEGDVLRVTFTVEGTVAYAQALLFFEVTA